MQPPKRKDVSQSKLKYKRIPHLILQRPFKLFPNRLGIRPLHRLPLLRLSDRLVEILDRERELRSEPVDGQAAYACT